ncbi:class F sortase [Amycolatopsis sp. NPDC024027]|uniref:class F sortase n=1 Tax=Amycolatopsis sp. NPDC024027 TaxID=3154327 RepID=UPI0033EF3913
MTNHGGDWRGDDWFVDEWHHGTGWAAVDDEQPGGHQDPPAPKRGRGRLLTGFVLGAATVLAVEFGPAVVAASPMTVVTGTALPASGAAGAAAPVPSPSPTATASATPAAPAAQTPSSPSSPSSPGAPPSPPPQPPGTVRLPGGGTATLVRQNLGPGGELPVPANLGQAAWWGASLDAAGGASVFAGHVNWRGATGPFAELWTERIGTEVTIVDSSGKTWRYRISQLVTVHKSDLAARADYLFGPSGPHRVVLVTCGGRWVGGSDGYEENRVVIADPA